MAKCDSCGNQYDKAFEVRMAGRDYFFDCFECAIHKLAPECEACDCTIIGHGVEAGGRFYCSAHCAGEEGFTEVCDRAEHVDHAA